MSNSIITGVGLSFGVCFNTVQIYREFAVTVVQVPV